jgi:hypothetical protein
MLKNQISQYDLSKRPEISEGVTPFVKVSVPTTRKDVTPLNRKPGGLMEQSNASLHPGDQG